MQEKPVFKPEFLQELADACPLGPCSPELVQSWFDIAYPKMKARGYSRWKLAVAGWWSRVRDYELARARQRLDAMTEAAEEAELSALYESVNAHPESSAATPTPRFRVVS